MLVLVLVQLVRVVLVLVVLMRAVLVLVLVLVLCGRAVLAPECQPSAVYGGAAVCGRSGNACGMSRIGALRRRWGQPIEGRFCCDIGRTNSA
ncbi:hypothetical protein [Streptomyces sp. RKAG337]|uniref:hypothetical protein n=1 Tax=Streptomyces sp. RKAG337 TaxID=2893404 RepID=UPI00203495D3|nr:hypothetical protein [Streptomyces sp. RKAG337]MCM2426138.1 hypothetical protein [Streptomyces sp. RKAG337]